MSPRIRPGDSIDGYTVEGLLHAGGNGYAYRVGSPPGRDPGFPLIMKVPGIGRAESTIGIVSFEIEQTIQPQLDGPHVPQVVAVGGDPMRPYLVMEKIVGQGLADLVDHAPLALEEVARVGAALADAVHSVHRQDVIHFDLKPENFILRPSGEAVLLDFGFARHARYPDLLAEVKFFAAGSAAYVSPEQLQGNRGDPRSDIFALGAMLYQLATGQTPFGVPATYAGMRDRLWKCPPPPRSIVQSVTPAMQEVILRCLESDADRRYASAAHIAFDLRNPDEVELTSRSEWTTGAGFARQMRNWWRGRANPLAGPMRVTAVSTTRIILIAVDTEHPDDARHPALQQATRGLITLNPDYRLMLVSAIRAAPLGEGDRIEDTASGRHLLHRNRLGAWVVPVGLPASRTSLHVVESAHPAATILDLAAANHVDLIVIGAPGPDDRALAWWRSVASAVTAGAPCSVYLVREPQRGLIRPDGAN